MAKKRKSKGGKKPLKNDGVFRESSEFHDGLKLEEGADAFEAGQDAAIMNQMAKIQGRNRLKDNSGGIEELYALSGDSDSDSEVKNDDIEDQDDDNEDDIRAWGGKKKHFYGGNPNEKFFSKSGAKDKNDDLDEDEAEEAESKALQKKQLENLDEEDFFDTFAPDLQHKQKPASKESSDDAKVALDVKQLSKKEQIALFQRESPEFQPILADFFGKMAEIKDRLQPILNWCEEGLIPNAGPAIDYVKTKHSLSLNYCVNILAYVMFKTKNASLKLHPLTRRLVQFKQMLEKLTPLEETMNELIDSLLKHGPTSIPKPEQKREKSAKKRLNILAAKPAKEASKSEDFTYDEKMALEVYNAIRSKRSKVMESADDDEEEDEEMLEEQPKQNVNAEDEEEERRAITYQIAKNKGLQPKRSKLQRNPRVKHRHKFEKAKVRRKGQVREVRKELKRYGGEVSGINARVKKGIKLA